MESPKPKITLKTLLFPLVGLLAFFLYIYLFQVDILGILATLQRADPFPFVLAAVLSLVEVLFFVDILVPAESVSGEALRVYLVTKEQGESKFGPVVASLVTHRLLGMVMNVGVLIDGYI